MPLVAWLKRDGARAAYSSSGAGSTDHLVMEMFKQRTGVTPVHVPFGGGAPAVTALLSGAVQLSFQNLGSVMPHLREGRVKAILTTAAARSPLLPEVPTAVEAGLPDFVVHSWQALGGPAGMPEPLVRRIHAVAVAALHTPETERRLGEVGFEVVGSTPEEFAARIGTETTRWARIIKESGAKAD